MLQSFEDYLEDFLGYLQLEKGCSLLTVRNYRHYLLCFKDWMTSENIPPSPLNIDLPLTKQYRIYLASKKDEHGQPLKKITQNYYMIAIRSFLRYLNKNDVKTLSPDKIDLPKTSSREVLALDRDQLYKLLNSVDISTETGIRDRAILETLFSTGLRVAELVKLDREKIDLTRREITIIGKGGRARIVFFSEDAVYWLGRYLKLRTDQWKPLFIRYSRGIEPEQAGEKMRLTARTIQRIVQKYAKIAKIAIHTTPHVMRHSFATDLLLNGADLRSIQEMLGHKTISTTQIYTNITNKHLREVHQQFHSSTNEDSTNKKH